MKTLDQNFKLDDVCTKMETAVGQELETLRFVKKTVLPTKTGLMNKQAVEELVNGYNEKDALAFARTVVALLDVKKNDKRFKELMLDNARARLREFKNRG